MAREYILVVSAMDPVARSVADHWQTPESSGWHVDGAPIRTIGPGIHLLRRPGWHIRDEHLDRLLPAELVERRPVLVFPSVHRSERGIATLTVHPLGNPGPTSEVGGEPSALVATDPLLMTGALRSLAEEAKPLGVPVTFEATHHGPALGLPAFFAEIGCAEDQAPAAEEAKVLARVLSNLVPSEGDRVALAVGGGHYAPHFTDLALKRRWAFGHILSRHSLEVTNRSVAERACALTPNCEGIVFARAEDAEGPLWAGLGPRLKDHAAELRPSAGANARGSDPG